MKQKIFTDEELQNIQDNFVMALSKIQRSTESVTSVTSVRMTAVQTSGLGSTKLKIDCIGEDVSEDFFGNIGSEDNAECRGILHEGYTENLIVHPLCHGALLR